MSSPAGDFPREPFKMVRRTDPGTSVDAACSVDTTSLEKMVFDVIASFGVNGCIGDDVHNAMPSIGIQTLSPRYKPLLEKGLIEETGERRRAQSGRSQRVLRVRIGDPIERIKQTKKKSDDITPHVDNALAWLLMSRHADDEHVATAIRILRRAPS